jgi:hypothetical protein
MRSAALLRDADARYEEDVQRSIDDARELSDACEPWFDGSAYRLTPDELAEQDAYLEGQRAGHIGQTQNMNPWQAGTAEHDAWEHGRFAVMGA